MKNLKKSLIITFLMLFLSSCSNESNEQNNTTHSYFLSEIRPNYFENLNFESNTVKSKTAGFLEDFKITFESLESSYLNGEFNSNEDLENMRLVSQYFSFYCLALTGTYLDQGLSFEDINGDRTTGLFSGLPSDTPNYEELELKVMMQRAVDIIERAVNINGYNDKVRGFYVAVKQVQKRLDNNNYGNPQAHTDAINYASVRLVDYDIIENWNVLMSMVTMTNYSDSLNTFKNPKMNELLFNVNARLNPGLLPDLGGLYPEILGPLYRFDLNLKKIDWLINEHQSLNNEQMQQLDNYIAILNTASSFIENDKAAILNSWLHKYTFVQRKDKLSEIILYRQNMATLPKPILKEYIKSDDFKKAYQCYSCHASSGL